MKVTFVLSHPIQYYSPLFRELARRVDLHVFYVQAASSSELSKAGFGVQYQWDIDLFDGYSFSFLPNVATRPSLSTFEGSDVPSIERELASMRPDAVIVPGWGLKAYLQTLAAARQLRIPVLVRGDSHLGTPRGFLKRRIKELFWPQLLKRYSAALYVGENSRDYYSYYRYPPSRMYHSPHAVDNERFSTSADAFKRQDLRDELGIRSDEKVVLFAGKLIPVKRPVDAVEIVDRARREMPALSLLVAGSGPLEDQVRNRAAELRVPVRFIGFKNQTEMPPIYATADVLLLPSKSESWGLVCNEAIACGVPIVVSEGVGAARDLAAQAGAGLTYPVGNVEQGAQSLVKVLRSPPSRGHVLGVADRYSIRAAVDGICCALDNLCHSDESSLGIADWMMRCLLTFRFGRQR